MSGRDTVHDERSSGLIATARRPASTHPSGSPGHAGPRPPSGSPAPEEALANVVRHSGALSASARLRVDDGSLHVEVRDDGPTEDTWVPGVGLTSMRERVEQLGGGFGATGSASGGTVAAWLPVAAGEPAR